MVEDIKCGDIDILPDEFDPNDSWIRLDAYDRLKAKTDRYKLALKKIKDHPDCMCGCESLAEEGLKND